MWIVLGPPERRENPSVSHSLLAVWTAEAATWIACTSAPQILQCCPLWILLLSSVHMLPGWCGAGLPPFPTACLWLTHPAAITGVSVSARWDSPGGCGLTVCSASLQSQSTESMIPIPCRCARRPQCPVRNLNLVVSSCLVRLDWASRGVVVSSGTFPLTFLSISVQSVRLGRECVQPAPPFDMLVLLIRSVHAVPMHTRVTGGVFFSVRV